MQPGQILRVTVEEHLDADRVLVRLTPSNRRCIARVQCPELSTAHLLTRVVSLGPPLHLRVLGFLDTRSGRTDITV